MTIDNAVRLPENLAISILNAAASFDFDMIEAVDGYYRRHLMTAVEQGNVSRQKEILNELLTVLERHNEKNKNSHYSRNVDVIEQIVAIEEGLVSGDPTEWTMARADEFRTPAVSIAEVLKAGKEKMIEDLEAEMLTQARTRSKVMDDPDFEVKRGRVTVLRIVNVERLKAEKKAAAKVRKAIAELQDTLIQKDSEVEFYPLTNQLMGKLYVHIKELKDEIEAAEWDDFDDLDL